MLSSRLAAPGLTALLALLALVVLATLSSVAHAENYPTLAQVQQAITDSTAGWTAGANPFSNQSWDQMIKSCGLIVPPPSEESGAVGTIPPLLDLRASLDWRNINGENFVSSVKDQDTCGSCWAFAACAALESLRKIKGYTGCGLENLSEQFMVSCCRSNSACDGGNPSKTANCLRDTGTVDDACFPYTATNNSCNNRCSDWASRIRKIDSWSYASTLPRAPTLAELKSAIDQSPVWTTFMVHADFAFYKSGVYRKILGPILGGHAVLMVGYDDSNSCFICKNSWGSSWGENGYFRIAYSQIPPGGSQFGRWTQSYSLSSAFCIAYSGDGESEYEWLSVGGSALIQGDDVQEPVPIPFPFKFFCSEQQQMTISTNGWVAGGDQYWVPDYLHQPIPSVDTPPNVIAPLWTDLVAPIGSDSGVLYEDRGDGTFVIEYRNMEHYQEPWYQESFQIILYDPAVYPTPTGDGKIKFQYSEHTPDLDLFPGYTVGIQNEAQTCGLQSYYHFDYGRGTGKGAVPLAPIGRQQGEPIAEGMAIEFTAIPDGEDDQLPTAVSSLTAVYEEPFVRLNWDNPEYDVNGFELPFLDGLIIRMDGEPIADPGGAPGEAMEYSYREQDAGAHTYDVRAYLGSLMSDALSTELTVPTRVAYADHDAGNVRYTITDQGISGFTDSSQSAGSGFRYGVDDPNWLYVGGLWAGTDAGYVLNRDFALDPYVDWIFWNDVEGPTSAVSDQDYLARYDDSGHSFPKNLRVTQDSWSWSIAPYDDFAIVRYSMENWGDDTLEGLYVGQFMDWDIPAGNAGANQGATHAGLRMAYMWQDGSYPYVGVALLDTLPGTAPPVANLAFVHNATYVYANQYIDDVDRFHFLSGDDPAYVVPATTGPADWSAIVSAGPFDVDPGGSVEVAFAIVGGDNQVDILANAGRAHEIYTGQATAVSGEPETEYGLTLVQNWPNPFNPITRIRYTLPERLRVKLAVYNTSGRLVRTLVDEQMPAGGHVIVWDSRDDTGREVASGVYFCRLEVGDWSSSRKMVLLK